MYPLCIGSQSTLEPNPVFFMVWSLSQSKAGPVGFLKLSGEPGSQYSGDLSRLTLPNGPFVLHSL